MTEEKSKKAKKWGIIVVIAVVIVALGGIFFYEKTMPRVFTKPEYVKEVIVQHQNFESALDNFLDQVVSYNGSKASTEKLNKTADKFHEFVDALEKNLKPRVPSDSKEHYEQMMNAYGIYLEAIDIYKLNLPKNLGEERSKMIANAQSKLKEAELAMKNISNG